MSEPTNPVRPNERDENLELVKQMGADWYDPIPPEQYTCFQDAEFTLTPRGHRMLAELRAWTIRGRKGGRTAHASAEGRAIKLPRLAALLDLDLPAARKVWAELEEHGLGRKDEKGWLWLCGRVAWKKRKDSEDSHLPLNEDQQWEKFCTDFFPGYLAKQFQQLNKGDRHDLHQDIETWQAYEKQVTADAMAAARDEVQRKKDQYLAERYRVKIRRFERTADEKKRKPVVQLSLLSTPELSVQNSGQKSVQNAHGSLYNVENDGVQTTLNKELRPLRKSDSSSPPMSESSSSPEPANTSETTTKPPRSPRPTPAEPKPTEFEVVAVELRQDLLVDNDSVRKLIRACRGNQPDCSTDEILATCKEKKPLLKGKRNPVGFLLTAVPNAISAVAAKMRAEESRNELAAEVTSESPEEELARLEQFIALNPTHMQRTEFEERVAQLRDQLALKAAEEAQR